jgi:hypothetical protein
VALFFFKAVTASTDNMFLRRDIAKRTAALLGIMLTLLLNVQQSHAFCVANGCGQEVDRIADASKSATCCPGCPCSNGDDEHPSQPSDDNQPCGPDCWCYQPMAPYDAQRHTTESLQGECVTDYPTVPSSGAEVSPWQEQLRRIAALRHATAPASQQICVRLCRFLA